MSATVLVWIIGIVITETFGKHNSDYIIEDTRLAPNCFKAVFFILLVYGTLLFHSLVPFCVKNRKV